MELFLHVYSIFMNEWVECVLITEDLLILIYYPPCVRECVYVFACVYVLLIEKQIIWLKNNNDLIHTNYH